MNVLHAPSESIRLIERLFPGVDYLQHLEISPGKPVRNTGKNTKHEDMSRVYACACTSSKRDPFPMIEL